MSYKEEFKAWIETRPVVIQRIAEEYPPGTYRVKVGAPYSISAPGTEVILQAYGDDGMVTVLIPPENKNQEALDRETELAQQHGMSEEDLERVHKSAIQVRVEPKWLELLTNDLEE